MSETTEQEKISDALATCIHSIWDPACEALMRTRFGDDITHKAHLVYDAAMDCPVDWYQTQMNEALAIVADYLAREFPWLSGAARTQLNYSFIMTWK